MNNQDIPFLAFVRAFGAASDGDLVSCQMWVQRWAAGGMSDSHVDPRRRRNHCNFICDSH